MAGESATEEEDSYAMESRLDTVNYKVWLLRGGFFIVIYVARMASGNMLVEDYTLEFILADYNRHITEIGEQIKKQEREILSLQKLLEECDRSAFLNQIACLSSFNQSPSELAV